MSKFSIEHLDTPQDHEVNSIIMETASDIAEELALKDWGETRANFWLEDKDGNQTMCDEAQGIFNEYYDQYTDLLYAFTNSLTKIINPKY